MRNLSLLLALCASGGLHAAEGPTLGIGVDTSTGTYGSATTTDILSIPISAAYSAGNWTLSASVPWVRVEGDMTVVPGIGGVLTGTRGPAAAPGRLASSGLGDVQLAATYRLPASGSYGLSMTGTAKLATADEARGLGSGANDYGVALDAHRAFDSIAVFAGAGYTRLGASGLVDVDAVTSANVGASIAAGTGELGLAYGWGASPVATLDTRQEVTGFYTVPAGEAGTFRLQATRGLSDGSPDWGAGMSYVVGF